jgi:hypothetical protein
MNIQRRFDETNLPFDIPILALDPSSYARRKTEKIHGRTE